MKEKRIKRLNKMVRVYMAVVAILTFATIGLYVVAMRTKDAVLRNDIVSYVVPAICAVSLFFIALFWGYSKLEEGLKKVESEETEEKQLNCYKIKNKYYAPSKGFVTLAVQVFYCLEKGEKKKYYYVPHCNISVEKRKREKIVRAKVYRNSNFIDSYEWEKEKRYGGVEVSRIEKVFLSEDGKQRIIFFVDDGAVKFTRQHLTELTEEEQKYTHTPSVWEEDARTPCRLYENLETGLKENEDTLKNFNELSIEGL